MTNLARFRHFVAETSRAVEASHVDEAHLLATLTPLLVDLVALDDWLPAAYAAPHPHFYQQYLLYGDPLDRWSVVSFVWGPGQQTPVHDHTVWGLVGVLRGAEISTGFAQASGGRLTARPPERIEAGTVVAVSPTIGDVHMIANAHADRTSISIHVYGGNIGRIRRHVFDAATGAAKPFISGYSNSTIPNLWPADEAA
ncbi:MAG: cysteine dioxygenase [Xanthobacteraceae bacterium]|nr:cysteine dioxygenase [Xanthobacteraceae bacterium]